MKRNAGQQVRFLGPLPAYQGILLWKLCGYRVGEGGRTRCWLGLEFTSECRCRRRPELSEPRVGGSALSVLAGEQWIQACCQGVKSVHLSPEIVQLVFYSVSIC